MPEAFLSDLLYNCSGLSPEAGCDEAGRGCLAGPVYAAAVILPVGIVIEGLNDSKKLNERKRLELRKQIEAIAISWFVAEVDHQTIDEINILQASILAMHRALDGLSCKPEFIVVDGIHFNNYKDIPYECVPKGDGKYASVAAASVLAKTYRDEHMSELQQQFPEYCWSQNKGYPTEVHRQAIDKYGLTPYHRRSFRKGLQLQMDIS